MNIKRFSLVLIGTSVLMILIIGGLAVAGISIDSAATGFVPIIAAIMFEGTKYGEERKAVPSKSEAWRAGWTAALIVSILQLVAAVLLVLIFPEVLEGMSLGLFAGVLLGVVAFCFLIVALIARFGFRYFAKISVKNQEKLAAKKANTQ